MPTQGGAIVAPLYEAIKKDVVARLAKATTPDHRSCSTNQDCFDRTQFAAQFKVFGKVIPDFHWKVPDLWTSGIAS